MISAQKYIQMREWESTGSNLAPVDFDRMDEFEKKYNLQKIIPIKHIKGWEGGYQVIQFPRKELKYKLAQLLK